MLIKRIFALDLNDYLSFHSNDILIINGANTTTHQWTKMLLGHLKKVLVRPSPVCVTYSECDVYVKPQCVENTAKRLEVVGDSMIQQSALENAPNWNRPNIYNNWSYFGKCHLLLPRECWIQGSPFFPLMKFPDFSNISVIFPRLLSQGSKMQIIFIYDFKWGYYFKLKLHGDNWDGIKCYCLPLIFTNNEHVFHNVELIFNKSMSGNNWF